jgi:hypothetical protein
LVVKPLAVREACLPVTRASWSARTSGGPLGPDGKLIDFGKRRRFGPSPAGAGAVRGRGDDLGSCHVRGSTDHRGWDQRRAAAGVLERTHDRAVVDHIVTETLDGVPVRSTRPGSVSGVAATPPHPSRRPRRRSRIPTGGCSLLPVSRCGRNLQDLTRWMISR